MKRIKITAIFISLLATLSMAGCIVSPGFHHGMSHFGYSPHFSHGFTYGPSGLVFGDPCGPCEPHISCGPIMSRGPIVSCGPEIVCHPAIPTCSVIVKATGPPYFPQRGTIVDCRTSLSNIGKGVLLVGRGVRDMTAAPFVVVGNLLSGGCRFEVLTHCPTKSFCAPALHVATPHPCCSVSTSGCDTCHHGFHDHGFEHGFDQGVDQGFMRRSIQADSNVHSRAVISSPMPRRSSSVIQAAHVEPTTPGVRFVQPR